ncbi:uncharacterized protein A4U43_C05F1680 [Asparagus officinalis]|uniref:Uncharacterized protein n=1 Tax=Asparagus officinalis TaxID=4686 RepID=A0A5P1ESS1_ASPOF|nr:uncharacterized protein A4U43_C05F1680 [Asparagus officinalis]
MAQSFTGLAAAARPAGGRGPRSNKSAAAGWPRQPPASSSSPPLPIAANHLAGQRLLPLLLRLLARRLSSGVAARWDAPLGRRSSRRHLLPAASVVRGRRRGEGRGGGGAAEEEDRWWRNSLTCAGNRTRGLVGGRGDEGRRSRGGLRGSLTEGGASSGRAWARDRALGPAVS